MSVHHDIWRINDFILLASDADMDRYETETGMGIHMILLLFRSILRNTHLPLYINILCLTV